MIMTISLLVYDTSFPHLLIGGYKGRGKEGLGLRGGLVSKVLESRTKS